MAVQLDVVRRTLADRYDIEHVLGRGTMSDVFFGRERTGSRPVAVKVLRPEFAVTMVGDRFHREIAILARLQHPNILPLIASGESGGLVFYVMPCASGGTLKARLDSERQLSLDLRLRYREGDARGCR